MAESFAPRTPIIISSPLYLEMSVIVASRVGAAFSDARLRARFLFMRALLLTIAFAASAAAQLTINSSLPVATQGVPYTGQFTATGGTPPYHFALDQAVTGFQLSDSGQLTGTPPVTHPAIRHFSTRSRLYSGSAIIYRILAEIRPT